MSLRAEIEKLAARPIVRQFVKFCMIGATATLIHYAILIALVELAEFPLIPATSLGFVAGATWSYTLNRRFTFDAKPQFHGGLIKFIAVGSIGLAINALIVYVVASFGVLYIIAQMFATGTVVLWNFTAARLIVFREKK